MRQPVQFGKYLLLERISVGGMAEVFKAKAFGVEGFEKILAIKRILPSMAEDADFIQMFIDEAKIAGQLNHAHIAQIFELGRVEDSHFIAMEYVWGKDLLQMQNRFRRMKATMPFNMAAFIAAKMCEGLDYAHKKKDAAGKMLGIIHRDVSPQNVLVSYDGEVKVIDFGIAKAASRSTKTQAGVLKGKFGYMSPEQVRGLPLDRRSDVFAIATILYELLTAERLFLGESDFATLEKVRNVDVPPPSKAIPGIPAALEKIILRGLAKDAEDRYQWALEMQEDLQTWLGTLDPPFSVKQLSGWMREQFAAEIKRETNILEEQKRATRELKAPDLALVAAATASPGPAMEHLGAAELAQLAVDEVAADDPFADGPIQGEATQISTELPPEVRAVLAARAAEEQEGGAAPLAGQSTMILDGASPVAGALAGQSTMILDTAAAGGAPLLAQSTVILDTAGQPKGAPAGLSPLAGQSTVMLEAPSYPPPRPVSSQLSSSPITGQTSLKPSTGQVSLNPGTSQVNQLPYASRRSTLVRDLAIGVVVAVIVVGGVLGGRYLLTRGAVTGTLVVTVSPPAAAHLRVDGKERGAIGLGAPLTLKDLAAGAHTIVVTGDQGGRYEQQVTLVANDVGVVTAALAGLKPAPGTVGRMSLTLKTDGATVFLDGTQLDSDSWRDAIPLQAGMPHEFKIVKPEFESARFTVTLSPGEEVKREITLEKRVGHLEVKSEPPGADVNVNGKAAGKTPVKLDDVDPAKDARVTIRLKGYASATKYVSFSADSHQALDVKLAVASVGHEDEEGRKADALSPPNRPKASDGSKDKPPAVADKGDKDRDGDELASVGKPAVKPAALSPLPAGSTDGGFLVANTQPWAKVIIDGKDTGKTTPIAPRSKIPLKPGKHVVTFLANGKKYNFDIDVKPGEDFRLIRQLSDAP